MNDKTLTAIFEHTKQMYPNECCGVIAQKSRVEKYFPCKNLAPNPAEQFQLDPGDYLAASIWGTITGIVHSHPDATTMPSDLDEAQCDFTELPWHIVSYPEGDFRTIYPRGELPLLGRPFVLGVYDCYGLIMSYYRQQCGIELNDYRVNYHWWEQGENLYIENFENAGFVEVTGDPQTGDVIIMQVQADVPNHAGVLLEGNLLLHHLYGQLSQKVPYGGYWKDRTIKIVRYHLLL
ncbi:putative phage minor tail protein (phage tail protein) [Xenorhabdus bovienii SS-2004]|uniref:Putative phage minor tail protein ( phage tail protein) n=1 Tax=Xenorhabdus bovienii (strain SS-2004) TaxID=406818 RepID=D3UZG4_XENBS|nr:C40 family peptidase [Xenorhabdus bovienii]CBJ79807.1 putative phage minor tail protein (phage tail protein) [Xenorhabdus bovienii SS-2004]